MNTPRHKRIPISAAMRAVFGATSARADSEGEATGETVEVHEASATLLSLILDSVDHKPIPPELAGELEGVVQGAEFTTRYEILHEHASGGAGRVYLAFDRVLKREVALKEILTSASLLDSTRSNASQNQQALLRFLREARITGQLQHPGIVPVHEIGLTNDGNPFYTMKFVRGNTLRDLLKDIALNEAFDARDRLRERLKLLGRFADVCDAVAFAHDGGVIHRDLKPSNIMIGSYGETLVLDWGIATRVGRDSPQVAQSDTSVVKPVEDSGSMTLEGSVLGTPAYMAPEQARGTLDQVDTLSDVYALGSVLYHILTGQKPFDGTGSEVIAKKVEGARVPPVLEVEPAAPPELASLAEAAMLNDRSNRLPSVAQFRQELQAFTDGNRLATYRYTLWAEMRRLYRRYRVPAIAMLLVLLAMAAGTMVSLYFAADASEQAELAHDARQRAEAAARAETDARVEIEESLRRKAEALREATSFRVATVAGEFLDTDPGLSLRLALYAHEYHDSNLSRATIYRALFRYHELGRFSGQRGYIHDVEVSPDGKRYATLSPRFQRDKQTFGDNTVMIWDSSSHQAVKLLQTAMDDTYAMAFSNDSRFLRLLGKQPREDGGSEAVMLTFDLMAGGAPLRRVFPDNAPPPELLRHDRTSQPLDQWVGHRRVGAIDVFSTATGERWVTIDTKDEGLPQILGVNDNGLLYLQSHDGGIDTYSLPERRLVSHWEAGGPNTLNFTNQHGDFASYDGSSNKLQLFRVGAATPSASLEIPRHLVPKDTPRLSPDAKYVVAYCLVKDPVTEAELMKLMVSRFDDGSTKSVDLDSPPDDWGFGPEHQVWAIVNRDSDFRQDFQLVVADANQITRNSRLQGHRYTVNDVTVNHHLGTYATVGSDQAAIHWSPWPLGWQYETKRPTSQIGQRVIAEDNDALRCLVIERGNAGTTHASLIAMTDGTAQATAIWPISLDTLLHWKLLNNVTALIVFKDAEGLHRLVHLDHDLAWPQASHTINGTVLGLVVSPDESECHLELLASPTKTTRRSIRLADLAPSRDEVTYARGTLSPNGRFASYKFGTNSHMIGVTEVDTGVMTDVSPHQGAYIHSDSWSPDGRYVLTAAASGSAGVVDTNDLNQRPLQLIGSHGMHVHRAALRADFRLAATVADSQIRLFNVDTREEILMLDRGILNGNLVAARFSRDGQFLIIKREKGAAPVRLPLEPYDAATALYVRKLHLHEYGSHIVHGNGLIEDSAGAVVNYRLDHWLGRPVDIPERRFDAFELCHNLVLRGDARGAFDTAKRTAELFPYEPGSTCWPWLAAWLAAENANLASEPEDQEAWVQEALTLSEQVRALGISPLKELQQLEVFALVRRHERWPQVEQAFLAQPMLEMSVSIGAFEYPPEYQKLGIGTGSRLVAINGEPIGSRVGIQKALMKHPNGPWKLEFDDLEGGLPVEEFDVVTGRYSANHGPKPIGPPTARSYRRKVITSDIPFVNVAFREYGYPPSK